MSSYPKPEGWNGGPDGKIVRQGSGSRNSIDYFNGDDDDYLDIEDRRNSLSFDSADFADGGLC